MILPSFDEVVKDWWKPGVIKTLDKRAVRIMLAASDKSRFNVVGNPVRLIDRWNWSRNG